MKKAEAIKSIEEFITDSLEALEYETRPVRIAEIEINIKEARRQIKAIG